MRIGGQEHFYLEGQIALAVPGEDDEVTVYSSTQHPSEIQHMVAKVLDVPSHAVTVEIRRMGGGFGGKETQGNLFACLCAIVAKKTGRAAKARPDRDDDMIVTGKRHDFVVDYEVGFDGEGRIHGLDMTFAARCGWSSDLSGPVTDRALFHADNCYWLPAVELRSLPLKTNTVSNTAFRGFGGPQGMVGGERVLEEVAFAVGRDPLEVRKLNFYGQGERNITPYHQTVEDNVAQALVAQLEARAAYAERREAVRAFNAASPVLKRGLALTPVKFGISFTMTAYNQAGALVHVYTDGSVHLNHGGTEMGQGLHTKVAQVVAEEFQIDLDRVRITATTTGKVPNTSATAASSGADLNGQAALAAARTIKHRLIDFAAEHWSVPKEQVVFLPNRVRVGNQEIPFRALVWQAYMGRVSLSSTGFYKTPKIHWDRASGTGRPFYYYRLRCRLQRGHGRHADRRVPGRARRHPARLRQVAEPGDRHRPDRGRLRPGHGLAHHRGAVVGRGGPAAHPRAEHLQDPRLRRPPAHLQRPPVREREPRGRDLPLQGGGRAAADAGHLGPARDLRRRRQRRRPPHLPAPRCAGDARARARRGRAAAARGRPGGACGMNERLVPELGRAAGRRRARRAGHRSPRPRARRRARPEPRCWSRPSAASARSVVAGWNGKAIAHARALLARRRAAKRVSSCRLGPAVGQCCGGHVDAVGCGAPPRRERAELEVAEAAAAAALPTVLLFGAGHVGRALAAALAPLPLRLRWIDGRADEFPAAPPAGVEVVVTDRPLAEIEQAPAGSAAFVLTHSHSLDFTLCSAVLERGDFAYLGLIGSRTKRAKFERGLPRARHLRRARSPPWPARSAATALRDKRPPVIAALAAAEVLAGAGTGHAIAPTRRRAAQERAA